MFHKEKKEERGKRKETQPCVAWLDGVAPLLQKKVLETIDTTFSTVPLLSALRTTPQSAPYHCEGPFVVDHVARMLTTIFAIENGSSLLDIEEFAREKHLALDVAAFETTMCEHIPFLIAFAFAHDAAKPETAFFDTALHTKGAGEGFAQTSYRSQKVMTDSERHRYDKLFRAFCARHSLLHGMRAMGEFFDAYGIGVHYDHHATLGASAHYNDVRQQIAAQVELPHAQIKMLGDIIRSHIDVIHAFQNNADRTAYAVIAAKAGKAGFNVDVYLDLALAALFLDAVAGSVVYERGVYHSQTHLVVNMLHAEREAMPRRHEERELAFERNKKNAYKTRLAAVGLDGESVFSLLNVPIGPVRGEVMRKVQALIDNADASCEFREHEKELRKRIAAFHKTIEDAL